MTTSLMSRRDALKVGAGLLAATAVPALHAEDAKDEFGGWVVGVQTYTFRQFKLEQALKRIQDLGIRYGEFYRGHLPVTNDEKVLSAFKKLCGDVGITPVAFGVERFTKDADANRKLFDFGKALGIKHFSADPDPDSFDSLDKLVDEYKISIAIHPHGPVGGGKMHRWYSAENVMAKIKDHHPLIGTCLDTGHLIRSEQLNVKLDPPTEIRTMGARNFGLHLKDHDNKKKTDVVYGKGVLNVNEVLKALREVKFTGYIAVEYEANPADPTADVKACLDVLKAAIAKS